MGQVWLISICDDGVEVVQGLDDVAAPLVGQHGAVSGAQAVVVHADVALAAVMVDEDVAGEHDAVARLARAHAVIVVLVAAGTEALVEQPDAADDLALDEEAEADEAMHVLDEALPAQGPGRGEGREPL